MPDRNRRRRWFLGAAAIFAATPAALTAQPRANSAPRTPPNMELLDQHGRKVHFYSDLIAGKVAVINTIFTTCSTICPLMGASFSKLSRSLGEESRGKVSLISISIDPGFDSPERLDEWSRTFGKPGPAWTLLTGPKTEIDALLKALEIFTAEKLDHAPVALIGDGTGPWVRASVLETPNRLRELIRARLEPGPAEGLARH
jgi:protein SCO1/2